MSRFVGYMLRPSAESRFMTGADEQYCRDLAHEIFGTSRLRENTAFCETYAFWWMVLCVVFRFSIIDMLEVWDVTTLEAKPYNHPKN